MITTAFTCTGPYAILIMLGIKRVENRSSRPDPAEGRCAVSCSRNFCKEEFGNFVKWASQALSIEDFSLIPAWSDVSGWSGKVVGCVDYSCSEGPCDKLWDEGYKYWWNLSGAVCFDEPISCLGNTGMWPMPDVLARMVDSADEIERIGNVRINGPVDAAVLFRKVLPIVGMNEGFFVLPLDEYNHPKSKPILVSLGTDSTTTAIQMGDVFSEVFKYNAKQFVVAHNHPRGSLVPSVEDLKLTRQLKLTGETLGVTLLDHLVLGHDDQFASIGM